MKSCHDNKSLYLLMEVLLWLILPNNVYFCSPFYDNDCESFNIKI